MLGRLLETGTNYKTGDSWSYIYVTLRLINQFLEEKNTQEQPKPGA